MCKRVIVLILMLMAAPSAFAQVKTITGGGFQGPGGAACSGCILFLQLNQDATVSGTGQVVHGLPISLTLDANGNVPAGSTIWGNDQLTPTNTYYAVALTLGGGGTVWGPIAWSLVGNSPINLSTVIAVNPSPIGIPNPALLGGNNTFTGTNVFSNLDGELYVNGGSTPYTTLALAYAACPTAPTPCNIHVVGNLSVPAELQITGANQPTTISCRGSEHNGGGDTLTFTATTPSTMIHVLGTAARFSLLGCSLTQTKQALTNIVCTAGTCVATPSGGTNTYSVGNVVTINGGNQIGSVATSCTLLGPQVITATTSSTFTFVCGTFGLTSSGNGLQSTLAGNLSSITQIAGAGGTATITCPATCPWSVGQIGIVFGSTSGAGPTLVTYNGAVKFVTVSGTSATFVTNLTTTITGGTVFTGMNGVIVEGSQPPDFSGSTITGFSGIGIGITNTSGGANGNYGNSRSMWSWFSAVDLALFPTGNASTAVTNQNKFDGCVFTHGALFSIVVSGNSSENAWMSCEWSGANAVLFQHGDGVSINRDFLAKAITLENVSEGSPASQVAIQNAGSGMELQTEGALTGVTPTLVSDVAGGTHWASIGSGSAPASGNNLSGTGSRIEFNMNNFKLDANGNMAIAGGSMTGAGASAGLVFGANGLICGTNFNNCRLGIDATGNLQGRSGTPATIGTTGNPVSSIIMLAAPLAVAGAGGIGYNTGTNRLQYTLNNGAADNLVGAVTTDTLTNKTLTSPVINGTPTGTGIRTTSLKSGSGAGNYSGTNTAYSSVDTTNLCAVFTVPSGWKLIVTASAVVESITAAVAQNFSLSDVGTTCGGAGITPLNGSERVVTPPAAGTFDIVIATQCVITGDGAAHSVALQAKTSNAADGWGIQNTSATAAPSMIFNLVASN